MSATLPSAQPLLRAAGFLGASGILLIGVLALLQPLPRAAPRAGSPAVDAGQLCTLRPDGYLRGRFFGALDLTAGWSGKGLVCDGMRRPDGAGVRLFFESNQQGGDQVAVLIAVEGRMESLVGAERPANVTVIDRRGGRFFSTGGTGRCWASIKSVTPLPASLAPPAGHRIDGLVYCVGSLPSIGDRSSLTLGEIHFAGRVSRDEA